MTSLTLQQIGLYGVAMAVLFAVPGPVWLMLVSRCLHHGLIAGIAVAIGVTWRSDLACTGAVQPDNTCQHSSRCAGLASLSDSWYVCRAWGDDADI